MFLACPAPWPAERNVRQKTPRPKAGLKVCVGGEKSPSRRDTPSAEDRQDSSHPPERRISTVSNQGLAEMSGSGCVFSVTTRLLEVFVSDPRINGTGQMSDGIGVD